MKIPAILETAQLSDNRRLVLFRREGKRITSVQIDKPIHETSGICFVSVLAHRKCSNEKEARKVFSEWLGTYSK